MVSVPAQYHLSAADEKAQYDQHQNTLEDAGYRKFLSRTFEPLVARIQSGSLGLDFGCGPGPVISQMAEERGLMVSNYDLYYFNQPELLKRQYNFVTMTEVIEHVANPQLLLIQLNSILKQAGILAIMTKRVIDQRAFSTWHYKIDPTHICFYSLETFEWIGRALNWRLEIIDKDVVFFYKE
jgi:2-polyprenyl-3-methyl-5-hydroxy-6-metoxy-1,4-benzoquinol methylase